MAKPKLDRAIVVPQALVKELLTDSEWRMVKQRLLIINLLQEGLSIRKIAERVKVGTDTVVRMSRKMQTPSLKKALEELKSGASNEAKWVFGKSED